MKINTQIKELRKFIQKKDIQNPEISDATIGWQIDHALRVIISIITVLEKSNPNEYKWKFNLSRMYIMVRGSIPRGAGKAPKAVVSKKESFDEAELQGLADKAEEKMGKVDHLAKNTFFNHPYFGDLNKKTAVEFIQIHTEHHLKIIRDIDRK